MNILHSTGMPFPTKYGGFEKWLTEVGKKAKEEGHTLYISYRTRTSGVEAFSEAMQTLNVNMIVLENDTDIEEFCRGKEIDIVHFHFDFMEHDKLYQNLWKMGIRLYATLHCECGYAVNQTWRNHIGQLVRITGHRLKMHHRVRYFSKVLPCSWLVGKQYSSFYRWPRDKVEMLYLGIAQGQGAQGSRRSPNDIPVIACVAFHSPVKGVDILLHALKILKERNVAFKCCQMGGGSAELNGEDTGRLKNLCADLGLDDVVEWVGVTNRVNDYLSQADIYCQPSRSEAICLSIAEAMSHGLPIVASDVGGIHELVKSGHNGWLVESENPQMLADKLEELICNKNLRMQMGNHSLQRLDELQFYQNNSVKRMYQIYQENR